MKCYYCGEEFDRPDLRPYGPDRAMICHPCGVAPEHADETERNFAAEINAQSAVTGVVIITDTGLQPGMIP